MYDYNYFYFMVISSAIYNLIKFFSSIYSIFYI